MSKPWRQALRDAWRRLLGTPPESTPVAGPGTEPALADPSDEWPVGLPPAGQPFVGRVTELRLLDQLLTIPETVVIEGPPGVGKTALVRQWANDALRQFPGGALYLALNGTDSPGQIEASLTRGLQVLGVQVSGGAEELSERFRWATGDKQLLVILDGVASAEQASRLLPAPGNAVVITTRDACEFRDKINARTLRLAPLDGEDAQELFHLVVNRNRTRKHSDAVEEVVRHCERLPLKVLMAAHQLANDRKLTVEELARRYRSHGRRDQAVIEESYRMLRASDARALLLVGVQPLPALSIDTVAAVVEADQVAARCLVDRLSAYRLVEVDREGKVRLHSMIRDYVLGRATDEDIDQATRVVTAWYTLNVARAGEAIAAKGWAGAAVAVAEDDSILCPFSDAESLQWLDAEFEAVLILIREAQDRVPEVWKLPIHCLPYLYVAKPWSAFLECAQLAVRAARRSGDLVGIARSSHLLAWIQHELGNDPEALRRLSEALGIHQSIDDKRGRAWIDQALGEVYTALHRYTEALGCFEAALFHFRTSEWSFGTAVVRLGMAVTLERLGRRSDAFEAAAEALRIAEGLNNPSFVGLAHQYLGALSQGQGRHEEAIDSFRAALRWRRAAAEQRGEAESRFSLARSLLACRRRAEARSEAERSLVIFEKLGDPQELAVRAFLTEFDTD